MDRVLSIGLVLLALPTAVLAAPEMLSREWRKPLPLEHVTVITANPEAGAALVAALQAAGAEADLVSPGASVTSPSRICLGGIHTNRDMLPLYASYLSFGDAAYPGGDGYVIRTIASRNAVALEARTPEGEAAAAARFVELLGALEGLSLPPTLEVKLSPETAAKVRSAPGKGLQYALGGDPANAAAGVEALLKAADDETGWAQYGDYGIERYIWEYHYLQGAPGVTDEQVRELDRALLRTALSAADQWWRRKTGGTIGGRHQTMGTSCFTATVNLLRRCEPNDEARALIDQWWEECRAYWATACAAFHDDLEGIPIYYSPEPMVDWALMLGLDEDLPERLEFAAIRAYSVMDNLGYYAGTGTYEECRPGGLYHPVPWGWLLSAADYFAPGRGYDWLRQNMPSTGLGTWATGRACGGVRAFEDGSEPVRPDRLLGITTVPLGTYRHAGLLRTRTEAETTGRAYLPVEEEDATYEKLCFRDSFERDGQYFVLQGYAAPQADNQPPNDMNSLIRYTDLGHIWLHSNSEKAGALYRSAVHCTDGVNEGRRPVGCELQATYDGQRVGLAASLFPEGGACDWTRNVVWRKGRYFVLIDLLEQTVEGEFGLFCTFRTPQVATLQADGMLARAGDGEMRVRNADTVRLSLQGGQELEGAAVPTLLRQTQSLDGGVGSVRAFRNLVYATSPEREGELEIRPVGDMAALVRGSVGGEDELALIAASPQGTGISAGPFETDGQVVYVGLEAWVQAGGAGLTIAGETAEGNEGESSPVARAALEAMWRSAKAPERPEVEAAGDGIARRLWQVEALTPTPPAAQAPKLTCDPMPTGLVQTLLDRVVTRYPTVSWPAGEDVTLTLDLGQELTIPGIDFQVGSIAPLNTIPDPADYPEPRIVTVTLSNDDFRADTRQSQVGFACDATFEACHKGIVYPVGRWTSDEIGERARYVKLAFDPEIWAGGVRLNELTVRTEGPSAARFVGHVVRDVDGDGVEELLTWSDQAELVLLDIDGQVRLRKQMPGYITSADCYGDLHEGGPRLLVTTREARLYCLTLEGEELWRTDFLESAALNGDLPTGYSTGLMRGTDGEPLIVVGNYNLATFVSPAGNVQKYQRLPGAYQTMTVSQGFDYDGDGKENLASSEVWGTLSILDAEMNRSGGVRMPRGKGLGLEYWEPPTQERVKLLVCTENGVGILDLKTQEWDWLHAVTPLNDWAAADLDGDGRREVAVAKEDGYVLVYDESGGLVEKILVGEPVRAIAALGETLAAAVPGRIVELPSGRTVAGGECVALDVIGGKLVALGEGGVVEALSL